MRTRLLIAGSLVALGMSQPAMARDGQVYIELDAGGVIANDFETNEIEPATGPISTLDTDLGFDVGAILGYDIGAVRLEAEASYRQVGNKELTTPGGVIPSDRLQGDASALSFMGNALLDLGRDGGVQVFAGGGAGLAKVKHDIADAGPGAGVTIVDGDASNFAWQGLAGLRFPLSRGADLGLKYRYFNVSNYDFENDVDSFIYESDWASHSLMATVAFNLGGSAPPPPPPPAAPPPPPPPPPAPPPPPPPPRAVCSEGPYIVFFGWDQSDITPEAASVLDSAVTAYGDCGSAAIMLAGHTDRSGSTTYNEGLAQRRNSSVRDYLSARGIPDGRITSRAFGESMPRVPTADGVRELQNRRVEITYGPGAGM